MLYSVKKIGEVGEELNMSIILIIIIQYEDSLDRYQGGIVIQWSQKLSV